MEVTTRKAWSWRSLCWLEQMPDTVKSKDISMKAVKKELKAWVKHHIAVRGDRILWGQPLTGDMRKKRKKTKEGESGSGDGDGETDWKTRDSQGEYVSAEPTRIGQDEEREEGGVQVPGTSVSITSLSPCNIRNRRLRTMTRSSRKTGKKKVKTS